MACDMIVSGGVLAPPLTHATASLHRNRDLIEIGVRRLRLRP
jgi:hypothetical protein